MTLIADFTSRYAVIQMSDTLVSLNRQPPNEWDPRFNKTVIYLASDALVSISYSGLAYINQISTDSFIDRVLGELQHNLKSVIPPIIFVVDQKKRQQEIVLSVRTALIFR